MTTKKEQIAKLLAKGKTVAEIVTIVECSDALVYMTRKEINERGGDNKIIDAVVDDDTVKPKERIMPRPKKDSEGGASSDVSDLQRDVDHLVDREKNLLDHIAVLSSRIVKMMDRIEELEAAAAPADAE
jgi:hypothetical protein